MGNGKAANLAVEYKEIQTLRPYERNARTHSRRQIRQIDSIRAFGFTNPVLTNSSQMIVAGHGRVEAAKLLGMASVPTIRLENLSEDQIRAYVLADNKLAGCVRQLKSHLDDNGIKSKVRISRAGHRSGGAPYSRGALYKILENRLYLGEIPHKQQWYPGAHEAIVNRELWQAVQAKLAKNAVARRDRPNCKDPSLLTGMLFCQSGNRFTPSHAVKKGKRYRYYVLREDSSRTSSSKQLSSIPAQEIESLVLMRLKKLLSAPDQVVKLFSSPADDVGTTRALVEAAQRTVKQLEVEPAKLSEFFRAIALRVMVHTSSMELQFRKRALRAYLLGTACPTINDARTATSSDKDLVTIRVESTVKRCGGEMRLVIPGTSAPVEARQPALSLLTAVARGHEWVRLLETGKLQDQRSVAAYAGLDERYISRILPSAFLAPTIVEAILEGRQPADLSLDRLLRHLPPSWEQQRVRLEQDLGPPRRRGLLLGSSA